MEMSASGKWKAVCMPRNHPQLVVDALHRPVRNPGVQIRQDALRVFRIVRLSFTNGSKRDRRLLQPLFEQIRRLFRRRLTQDGRQVLLHRAITEVADDPRRRVPPVATPRRPHRPLFRQSSDPACHAASIIGSVSPRSELLIGWRFAEAQCAA